MLKGPKEGGASGSVGWHEVGEANRGHGRVGRTTVAVGSQWRAPSGEYCDGTSLS